MKRMIGLTAVLAIAGFGCGDDDGDTDTIVLDDMFVPEEDGGPDDVDMGGGDVDMGGGDVCVNGEACTMARGCRTANATCFEPALFGMAGLGGADDPILNHPDGDDTFVSTPLFPGGYCTTSWPQDGVTPSQCDLRDDEQAATVCGDCASCIDVFGLDTADNTDPLVPGMCAQNCSPSLDSNDCRDGYDCLLTLEVCFLGCQQDDECRITREDNNGVPGIQTPADCEDAPADCTPDDCGSATPADPDACDNPGTNFDNLVYDTESAAICDPNTSRCTGAPSNPAASGGDTCTEDSDCEAEGFCIEEDPDDGSWAGGACTKFRCDLPGNECANDGVCQEAGVGVFACFEGCTVGGFDTTSDPSTWVVDGVSQTTCRDGYGCFWGGTAAGGTADNGVCLPIEYSEAVTAPNTGDPCTEDSDCFSPFGNGFCITGDAFPGGYCSVRNCAAPWFTEGTPDEQNVCGDSGVCVGFDEMDPTFALCVQECTSADDCNAGLGCVDFTADSKACWPGCATDADCRTGERCSMPGTADAACVPE